MEPLTPDEPAHPPLARLAVEPLLTGAGEARHTAFHDDLRARYGPVAPVDAGGVPAWLVLGYPQMLDVLRDARGVWSKDPAAWREREGGRVPADWPHAPQAATGSALFADGAALDRLRAAWAAALAVLQDRKRPEARALERGVARDADELITALVRTHGATGTADLAAGYARPLALLATLRLLGLPDGVRADLAVLLGEGPDASAAAERVAAAVRERCAQAREARGADLASLLHAADPGLTADELAGEAMLAVRWVGGHTGALICSTILEASGDGAGSAGGLLPEAVNRAALHAPPASYLTFRCPRSGVRLGRYHLAAGDPVLLSTAAAHADPSFAGGLPADAVHSSRAHLAWGAGPHACLGRDLATGLAVLAVERLAAALPVLRPAVPRDELEWRATPLVLAPRELPMRYEAAVDPGADAAGAADPEPSPRPSRRRLRLPRRSRDA
ncbi:Cytochrome P450 107B1 [Actinomadura rubteroloni]|uniref:Cytochrome P450 107B1 n=1 Tax=Actinomadura rubteroloni TaxID=1926885 RepID=A0A2P4UDL8_9ACTN|nr:cytochrome [Actinomadura rubteroloni]POM23122.1 Cytochrome P450 107B1 [Actinomadura rubteroloni]